MPGAHGRRGGRRRTRFDRWLFWSATLLPSERHVLLSRGGGRPGSGPRRACADASAGPSAAPQRMVPGLEGRIFRAGREPCRSGRSRMFRIFGAARGYDCHSCNAISGLWTTQLSQCHGPTIRAAPVRREGDKAREHHVRQRLLGPRKVLGVRPSLEKARHGFRALRDNENGRGAGGRATDCGALLVVERTPGANAAPSTLRRCCNAIGADPFAGGGIPHHIGIELLGLHIAVLLTVPRAARPDRLGKGVMNLRTRALTRTGSLAGV